MKETYWMVSVLQRHRSGIMELKGIHCDTEYEANEKVGYWTRVAIIECVCGNCPEILKIERVKVTYEAEEKYAAEGAPHESPPDAWKGLFK